MKKYYRLSMIILVNILIFCSLSAQIQNKVAFPENYRNWNHLKSEVIMEGHIHYKAFGGFHHVYANDNALKSLKVGKSFSDGSILVFDLLEEKIVNNAIVEGPRKVIGVMEKDNKRFVDTEGWGFEDFKNGDPEKSSVTDMRIQCLSCHEKQKEHDYVYSKYRY